jgi:myo-inositol-1(or 4)-monophosphatase
MSSLQQKGRGAFLNQYSIRISAVDDLKNSLITTGFPFRRKELIDHYLSLFRNIFIQVSDLRRPVPLPLTLPILPAEGVTDFFEIGLFPWDIATGKY